MGSNPSESDVELASFNLINQDRKDQGLPALTLDPQLTSIARAHSADMRDRNFVAHVNPDGNSFSDRLRRAGLSFRIAGENLAVTTSMSDPATFANAEFLGHTTHRANILNQKFTRVGVGVARSGSKYWITQDFIGN